jgi:hypothetical protein
MTKFKVGDRVVVKDEFVPNYSLNSIIVGEVFNILEHRPNARDRNGEWYRTKEGRNAPDNWLELEEVYYSPLNKALK